MMWVSFLFSGNINAEALEDMWLITYLITSGAIGKSGK